MARLWFVGLGRGGLAALAVLILLLKVEVRALVSVDYDSEPAY